MDKILYNRSMLKSKLFLQEILLFLAVGILALAVGIQINRAIEEEVIEKPAEISFWQFIIAFLVITSLTLVFLKFFKGKGGKLFFQIFLFLAIFIGAQTIFSLILPPLLATIFAFLLVILRIVKPRLWTHNLSLGLGIAGISATLGIIISWQTLAIILAVLSVYDIIAVYKTKHMVKMAKASIVKGAPLALVIPENFSFWNSDVSGLNLKGKRQFLILGTGDLALPIAFAVSVISEGLFASLIVIGAALAGLFLLHLLFSKQKKPQPMPALPPIAACCLVGFLVYLLIA